MRVLLFLVAIQNLVFSSDCLVCLSCNEVLHPRDCQYVQICGEHERCFTDGYVTSSGNTRFNVGCRDSRICVPARGRRSIPDEAEVNITLETPSGGDLEQWSNAGDVTFCTGCCDGDICNQNGCEEKGLPNPVCYSCDQQSSPTDCNKVTSCGEDEMCGISTRLIAGDVVYSTGCTKKSQACNIDSSMISKYDVLSHTHRYNNCTGCCQGNMCNNVCLTPLEQVTPTSPHSGNCRNHHEICDTIPKPTACSGLFSGWGRQNCPLLCDVCVQAFPSRPPPPCKDALLDCDVLDNGYMCQEFAEWAADNCRAYCHLGGC